MIRNFQFNCKEIHVQVLTEMCILFLSNKFRVIERRKNALVIRMKIKLARPQNCVGLNRYYIQFTPPVTCVLIAA